MKILKAFYLVIENLHCCYCGMFFVAYIPCLIRRKPTSIEDSTFSFAKEKQNREANESNRGDSSEEE